jgi:1-acyl-sn-glycerol-3-phosphate acyltransferase
VLFLTNPRWFHKFFWLRWLLEWFSALSLENNAGMVGAVRALQRGRAVGIFPEGARYREARLRPFMPGVGFLAIRCRVPVVPALLVNSELSLWQTAPRFKRARLVFGAPIYPDGYEDTREEHARFAARVRDAIEALRGPD